MAPPPEETPTGVKTAPREDPRPNRNRPRRRPSFRVVLLLVILPQIALAVTLTGWLSYRSARKSIEDVAGVLREETSQRIQESLTQFFELAPVITHLNQENVRIGQLDVSDLDEVSLAFWKQLQVFESLGWVTFGRADGGYVSLQRLRPGVMEIDRSGDGATYTHVLRPDGTLGELLRVNPGYDPTARPWYTSAVEAGHLVWTEVYKWFNLDVLCVDAVAPVYDEAGNVLGVLDAGFSLSGLSEYLAGLRVSRSGRTFVVGRDGLLIAASAGEVLAPGDSDDELTRVAAVDSSDPLVRESAAALNVLSPDLGRVGDTLAFDFERDDSQVFVQVSPLNPAIGLDWLIAVVIPDDELMTHVEANVRNTILASLVAMLGALLVSALMTRWLAQPLIDLAARARRIQHGDLDVKFIPRSRDEIGVLTETMGDMVQGLKERERFRDAFGRYVAEEVAQELLTDPEALAPGGTLQSVTVLMSDLRGFSVLTARLGPSEMVHLLNLYLGRMIEVIREHNGLINDFIGDAILVIFGAPTIRDDDTARCFRCALAMQLALDALNREIEEEFGLELEMGIGIDRGDVIVGNIGGEQRVKYGVIGDAVNMAARIESLTVGGQILVSRGALERAGHAFELGPPITVKVKGRDEALTIFELLAVREDPNLRVRAAADAPMRDVEIEADLWVLSGKSVADTPDRVHVTRMGKRALELVTHGEKVEPLQNVKVRLRRRHDGPSGWYAKVRTVEQDEHEAPTNGQRAVVMLTHEAERTLEERLRERLARVLGEHLGAVGDLPSGPQAGFLRQLATAPIEDPADREVATRALVEMAAADGILEPAEREFVGRFIGTSLDAMEAIMTREPLSFEELAAVADAAVRETILMLSWATALCDADLAKEEADRLAELAAGFHIDEERALELRGAAQLFLADAAFSIVWPATEAAHAGAPEEVDEAEREEMSSEYATLIERWVPRYAQLLDAALETLPPALAPTRIVQLGGSAGRLADRLMERFPDAELLLVEPSTELADRARRRLHTPRASVMAAPFADLDLPAAERDLVVSAVALHGLDEPGRRRLYASIQRWLRPGGCFAMADVFFAPSAARRTQQLDQWREAAFALGATEADWAALMERRETWTECARLEVQLRWLAEAGFAASDCTWRASIWAVVVALAGS